MLAKVAHYNNLSDGLRAELEKSFEQMPKKVRYRFNISHHNPDPEKYNGDTVWPSLFNLPSSVYDIVDNKNKVTVAMVATVNDKGIPDSFNRIQVWARDKGFILLDLENPDDQDKWAYLELHPRNIAGKFKDPNKEGIFFRVDEVKEANLLRKTRSMKADALIVATRFTEQEVRDFASAMTWDEQQDIVILRNEVEKLAEEQPAIFHNVVNEGTMQQMATVKRAFDKHILIYHPVESRVSYSKSGQTVAVLERAEGTDKNEIQLLVDNLMYTKDGPAKYDVIRKLVEAQSAS